MTKVVCFTCKRHIRRVCPSCSYDVIKFKKKYETSYKELVGGEKND
jgi:hypothetical protein